MHCDHYNVCAHINVGIPDQDQMQAPDRDLGVAIVVTVVIIMVTLISSGAIIVIVLLMCIRAKRRIQQSPSTCANNPIYEEPDHHVNIDHSIAISDKLCCL